MAQRTQPSGEGHHGQFAEFRRQAHDHRDVGSISDAGRGAGRRTLRTHGAGRGRDAEHVDLAGADTRLRWLAHCGDSQYVAGRACGVEVPLLKAAAPTAAQAIRLPGYTATAEPSAKNAESG